MLIQNWMGTRFLRLVVYVLKGGGGVRWTAGFILPPPYKAETINFRGIVPIQFLISIKLSIKWALDECTRTKLMFLHIMDNFPKCPSFKPQLQPEFIRFGFFVWIYLLFKVNVVHLSWFQTILLKKVALRTSPNYSIPLCFNLLWQYLSKTRITRSGTLIIDTFVF